VAEAQTPVAAQSASTTPSTVRDTEPASDSPQSSSAAFTSDDEEVRETHPGVYTSSAFDRDADADSASADNADSAVHDESPSEVPATGDKTTEVVESFTDSASPEEEVEESSNSEAADASPAGEVVGDAEESEAPSSSSDDDEAYEGVDSIPDTEFGEIDVDLIDANPRQPRTVFDEDLLAELVHSIREIGVLQPVVVRQKPSDRNRFELIMGERRLRATKDAGLSTIPAIIRYVEDTDLLRDALLENLHRAELNPLEEAAAYGQLLEDFGCTQEELSERIGRSRPQISNTLRLLRLPPLVQRRVAAGVISAGHARAILGLRDPEHMEVLAQRIVAEGLSVRASEEAVVLLNRGDSVNVSRATSKVSPEFLAVAERLGDRLETKVNISVGKKKGKLSVEFANQEDLDRILALLGIEDQVGS
jgi:ParB family chromosome partitioning protein